MTQEIARTKSSSKKRNSFVFFARNQQARPGQKKKKGTCARGRAAHRSDNATPCRGFLARPSRTGSAIDWPLPLCYSNGRACILLGVRALTAAFAFFSGQKSRISQFGETPV
nr:hypothetical protein [Pandoravirus massiliensis]